jgi:hypothetical protein
LEQYRQILFHSINLCYYYNQAEYLQSGTHRMPLNN